MRFHKIPETFGGLLHCFRGCFTRPGFRHFVGLVLGWVVCPGRHSIARIIQAEGQLLVRRHFSSVYRFLARGRWSVDAVSEILFRMLLPLLPREVTAIVDDTLCHHRGPHLFGGGMFYDAPRSTYGRGTAQGRRPQFSFGHNWVVLAVWVPLPWRPERGKAIPVAVRLYRSRAQTPELRYRKRTELGLELVQRVASWLPPERRLQVLGDAEYASRTVVRQLPERVSFVGPVALNAALYAPRSSYRGKGRPRKRGRRLASLRAWIRDPKGWTSRSVLMYGREVRILVKSRVCLWYTVAGSRPVQVVVTRDPRGRWQDRAYFGTDPEQDSARLLQLYARRWDLEVTFREVKQSLGLEHPRNGWWRRPSGTRRPALRPGPQPRGSRGQIAVLHTAPIAFVAYALTLVWYVAEGHPQKDVAQVRRHAPWYRHKRHPSFDDMLAALQREIWTLRLFANPAARRARRKSSPRLNPWVLAA